MSKLTLKSVIDGTDGKLAKVYFNRDYNEYVVQFFTKGVHEPKSDYFTDELHDARSTAKWQLGVEAPIIKQARYSESRMWA